MTNGEKSGDEKIRDLGIDIERLGLIAQTAASAAGGVAIGTARGAKEVTVKGIERIWEHEKTGAGYVLAAIFLSAFDYTTRWFGGLNIDVMMKNLSVVSNVISMNILNAYVLLAVFAYIFIRGIHKFTVEEVFSLFIFVEVAYFCLVLGGPSVGVISHILFAIITWFMLLGEAEDLSAPSRTVAFLLILDFFGMGLIGWLGVKWDVTTLSVFGNRVVSPVWFLFSLIYTSRYPKKPLWLKITVIGVVALYVFAFTGEHFTYAAFAQGLSQKEIKEGRTIIHKSFSNMIRYSGEVISSISAGTGGWLEKLISMGAGPYYGNPEETEPVGIFLEVEEPEAPVPPKASFYAEVEAKTLGIVESIPVSAKCWWGEEYEEENEGILTPIGIINIFDGESETFRCKFEALDPEAEEITFEANASGLESTGELPVFFIDEDLKRVMKKRGEDLFFGYYAGKSLDPRMTYTNGPLGIETTALNQPISLGSEDVDKVLGIRLRNLWDKGEISSINSLEVKLPRGVELSDCDYQFTQKSDEGHNIYSFDTSEFVPLKEINEEAYFLCDMTIKISEKSDLMSGPVKAHPRFFYIKVTYDFKIRDSVSIEIIGANKKEAPSLPPAKEVTHESERIDNYLQSKGAPWAGQAQCMIDASKRTRVPVILMLALPVQKGEWSGSELQKGYCPSYCTDAHDTYTNPSGEEPHNLFSIKGSGCWWKEEVNKERIEMCANFKNYNNYCESINDFADTVSNGYPEAMEYRDDPEEMVKQMLKAGWATDSEWADNVIGIMRTISSELG